MTRRGFTLIEILVYIVLLGVLIGGVLEVVYQLTGSTGDVSSQNAVQLEGAFVLQKIAWAMSGSSTILNPSPASPYTSSLSVTTAGGARVVIRLNSAAGAVEMSEDGGTTFLPLTTGNVVVSNVQFHYLSSPGSSDGVAASTTIQGRTFYATKYTRK